MHKMWRTKGSQFNARVRLDRRHWLSIGATTCLSCYLIAASLYQLAFDADIGPTGSKWLSLLNVVVSIFLLSITLMESAKNYAGQAEKMHASALQISSLYNRFQALPADQVEAQRAVFADDYSKLLNHHAVIHKDLDFALFKWSNAEEIPLTPKKRRALVPVIIWLSIVEYWLYVVLIVLPLVALWAALTQITAEAPRTDAAAAQQQVEGKVAGAAAGVTPRTQ